MLNQADVDRAKQELRLRRAATLKRHAEELQVLDSEQAEIDTLEQMAQAFSRKFGSDAEAACPAAGSGRQELVAVESAPEASPTNPACSSPQRKYQATNFELFARAFSAGTF